MAVPDMASNQGRQVDPPAMHTQLLSDSCYTWMQGGHRPASPVAEAIFCATLAPPRALDCTLALASAPIDGALV